MTVLREEFVLVVPGDHALAKQEYVEFTQLDGLPMVVLAKAVPLRGVIFHWFKEAGIHIDVAYECDTCGMMRELINTGKAIGLVPAKTWSFPFGKQIKILPIKGQKQYRYVNVICESQNNTDEVNLVYHFIADYFKSFNHNS